MSVLYQHQIDGALWLATRQHGRGLLGDVPGTGKTRTVIKALTNAGAQRPLIISPAIARSHWFAEAVATETYEPAREIGVRSYEEIQRGGNRLMKQLLGESKYDALVLDEIHRLSHATAKRTMQILGPDGYARRMPIVYGASGTPVPKNPSRLWTVLSALFPRVAIKHGLARFEDFIERFCTWEEQYIRGEWRRKFFAEIKNEAEFREILDEIMLRRTLDDLGLDVPEIDWQQMRLDSGELPDDINSKAAWGGPVLDLDHLEEVKHDPVVARMRRRLGELKAPLVVEQLASQLEDSDEKVVVFAHHRSVLETLRAGLGTFGVSYIDGDTTPHARDIAVTRFQAGTARVFIGQNIACMESLTLTAARRAVLVEPDWTADVNLQLGKRIARIGQRAEHVVVQMVVLAGTLDEGIVGQNQREVRMADKIGLGRA